MSKNLWTVWYVECDQWKMCWSTYKTRKEARAEQDTMRGHCSKVKIVKYVLEPKMYYFAPKQYTPREIKMFIDCTKYIVLALGEFVLP